MRRRIIVLAAIVWVGFGADESLLHAQAPTEELVPARGLEVLPGTGFVAAGVGLGDQPGSTIEVDVPESAEVVQVLLYWQGRGDADDTVTAEGNVVTGTLIGLGNIAAPRTIVSAYRADITALGLVGPGRNAINVADADFSFRDDGAAVFVTYASHSNLANLQLREGADFVYRFAEDPAAQITNQQIFEFPASDRDREARLALLIGDGEMERPDDIEVIVGDQLFSFSNEARSRDGDQWDTVELRINVPAGVTSTSAQLFSRDLANSGANPDSMVWVAAAFGFLPPQCEGRIAGRVWNDTDRDSIEGESEPSFGKGVVLVLKDTGGVIVDTAMTGILGRYTFSGLCPGEYTVEVDEGTLPSDVIRSACSEGPGETNSEFQPAPVLLADFDAEIRDIDFGYHRPCSATIGNFVWQDLNRDGIQDAGEPGIQGVVVTLEDAAGNLLMMQPTDGNGFYEFAPLCAGDYVVNLEPTTIPEGVVPTSADVGDDAFDSDAPPVMVSLPDDDTHEPTIDFGFNSPCAGSIGDFVWQDLNRDGVQDPGEPGIAGVQVLLSSPNGAVLAETTTDGAGGYLFQGLCAGDYVVDLDADTLPPDFDPSPVDVGNNDATDSDARPASVSLGDDVSSNPTTDFGFNSPCTGSVGDFVWQDLDRDGLQDLDEPGIQGVSLILAEATAGTIGMATTDARGHYSIMGLCAGDYELSVDVTTVPKGFESSPIDQGDDDAFDSDPVVVAFSLTDDVSEDPTLDFGFNSPCVGTIGDFVWQDLDRDGIQDPGEPGIQGVELVLKDAQGETVALTTTDGTGSYSFEGLCAGEYTLDLDPATLPPDFVPSPTDQGEDDTSDSDARPATVSLPEDNTQNPTFDFGFNSPCTGSIGDFVWQDLNRDGIQDAGEPGIDGVRILLKDTEGTVLAEATTAGGGVYGFSGLCRGDHNIEIDPGTLPADFVATPTDLGEDDARDSESSPAAVSLDSDTSENPTIDFGFNSPCTGSIGDFVWQDLDRDGVQDAGEPGIGGVTVTLKNVAGEVVGTTSTDGVGAYSFGGLCAGEYVVELDNSTLPPDFEASPAEQGDPAFDSQNSPARVTLADDTIQDPTVDFGFNSPCTGEIGDFVWQDLDRDGIQDGGEPGIAGVRVTLMNALRESLCMTTTDGAGHYSFVGLCAGTYFVEIAPDTLPDDFVPSASNQGNDDATDSEPNPAAVELATDESVDTTIDFGYNSPCVGTIGDFVWHDLNRDGIQDDDEPGVQAVEVRLTDAALGTTVSTAITDQNGFYSFTGLCAGNYVIDVEPSTLPADLISSPTDAGSDDTKDSDPLPTPIELSDDESTNTTLDYGFNSPCTGTIGDFVWRDFDRDGLQDAGEPGIANVTIILKDDLGQQVGITTTDNAGGYLFEGICAGEYFVEVDPTSLPDGLVPSVCNEGSGAGTVVDEALDSNCSPFAVTLDTDTTVDTTIDFAFNVPCSGVVGDLVWDDLDDDGIQDPNEPGIPDVTVVLRSGIGEIVGTTTTDALGSYLFEGLCMGGYLVMIDESTLPEEFEATISNQGRDDALDSESNPYMLNLPTDDAEHLGADFGFRLPDCPDPCSITVRYTFFAVGARSYDSFFATVFFLGMTNEEFIHSTLRTSDFDPQDPPEQLSSPDGSVTADNFNYSGTRLRFDVRYQPVSGRFGKDFWLASGLDSNCDIATRPFLDKCELQKGASFASVALPGVFDVVEVVEECTE